MRTFEEILTQARKYKREEIAYLSGVSLGSVCSIMSGRNNNPTLKTVQKLDKFLDDIAKKEAENAG